MRVKCIIYLKVIITYNSVLISSSHFAHAFVFSVFFLSPFFFSSLVTQRERESSVWLGREELFESCSSSSLSAIKPDRRMYIFFCSSYMRRWGRFTTISRSQAKRNPTFYLTDVFRMIFESHAALFRENPFSRRQSRAIPLARAPLIPRRELSVSLSLPRDCLDEFILIAALNAVILGVKFPAKSRIAVSAGTISIFLSFSFLYLTT